MRNPASKCLILRLSSLGDVILASAALQVRPGADWVVAQAFAEPLQGHPQIGKIWIFDKAAGFAGWKSFCRQLWEEGYGEVLDLHGSLRTRLARYWFRVWDAMESWKPGTPRRPAVWSCARKQRLRSWGYFVFKGRFPRAWRPRPRVEVFARAAGGTGSERPDLAHLLLTTTALNPLNAESVSEWPRPYVCVMPASRWRGKEWPTERYVELVEKLGRFAVILGTAKDQASLRVVERLRASGVPHFSAVGKFPLSATARALAGAEAYIGSDTGIAHLAEAIGTRAWVVFGPTAADGGFGPWRAESRAVGKSLWCRPCGKDGRFCFRARRQLCLSSLTVREVIQGIEARK